MTLNLLDPFACLSFLMTFAVLLAVNYIPYFRSETPCSFNIGLHTLAETKK
jgi:hypothetical protein